MRFQMLNANAPLQVGQRLVTLGSQGERPYVPGVPIGVIERIDAPSGGLIRTAYIRPFTNFTSLDVVAVVVAPPKADPRDAVLPPRPSPTPTPTPRGGGTPSPRGSGAPEARPSGDGSGSPRPTTTRSGD